MAARFRTSEAELRRLPGIGPYTAAAIAAIAFGRRATPSMAMSSAWSRGCGRSSAIAGGEAIDFALAETLTPDRGAGDFAQAMMDLGATICTPRSPPALPCPLDALCLARSKNIATELPRRADKPQRPTRHGAAFVVIDTDRRVLLRRRPPTGLLGGMHEVPSTEWTAAQPSDSAIATARPIAARFRRIGAPVVHIFTHFRLELEVLVAHVPPLPAPPPHVWADSDKLDAFALPSVMRKVIAAATGPKADHGHVDTVSDAARRRGFRYRAGT